MLQTNKVNSQTEEHTFLYSLLALLSSEVDEIFFSLRKADQIIRRELSLLNQQKIPLLKNTYISPINDEHLKKIIHKIPCQHLFADEYIRYMLENENNSIFKLILEYNIYLDRRKNEQDSATAIGLIEIDEKLVYYIRHLGAMTYHLNIHLNLLSVLLKNAAVMAESHHTAIRESKEIVTEYMVNDWGEQQREVRFLEITIDGSYAIVTWALEDLRGDAILIQNEGYWQLINIGSGVFGLEEFENANVPLEVAQRMLRLHQQKLGY